MFFAKRVSRQGYSQQLLQLSSSMYNPIFSQITTKSLLHLSESSFTSLTTPRFQELTSHRLNGTVPHNLLLQSNPFCTQALWRR